MSQKFLSSASHRASIGYMLHVIFKQTDTNKVGCCCVHVGDGVEMDATTPNNQQHAAGCTNPCNIQQCWELLANNVQHPFAWGFMAQFYRWLKLYFPLFQTH